MPATGGTQIVNTKVNLQSYTLGLGNGGLTLAAGSSSSATLSSGTVAVLGSQSWANNSNSETLTVGSVVSSSGATTLSFNGAGTGGVNLNGVLSDGPGGALSLVFNQAGVTALNTANTFSGGVTISSGTVQLGNNGALNASVPNAVTFGSGFGSIGDLQVNGNAVTVSSLNSNSSVQAVVENANGSTGGTLTVANVAPCIYGGTLQDGAAGGRLTVVMAGSSTLYLTGTSTLTGGLVLNAGIVNFASSAALPATGLAFGGGTLQWAAGNTQDISPILSPIGAGQTATLDPNGQTVTFNSALTGSGGLKVVDSGTLVLMASNSYSGATTANGGTLQIDNGGSTGTPGTGNIVVSSSGVLVFDRSDSYTVANSISGSGAMYQIGNGTLTLAGTNSGSGAITVTNSGALTIAGSTVSQWAVHRGRQYRQFGRAQHPAGQRR